MLQHNADDADRVISSLQQLLPPGLPSTLKYEKTVKYASEDMPYRLLEPSKGCMGNTATMRTYTKFIKFANKHKKNY